MKVEEIMTKDVIAVGPKASIHEAARLLADHGISGLPVVNDDGQLVGMVSEGDLIIRQKPRPRLPWWRVFFDGAETLAREYQKAAGTTVSEVMTPSVISVTPDLSIDAVAAILDEHRIGRVPVVSEGRLVGIVSRGDLVKALARAPVLPQAPASDARLVAEMKARMAREPWVPNRGILVQAKDGVVALWGVGLTDAEKSALETMARGIPGVKDIDSHLVVRADIPYRYGV